MCMKEDNPGQSFSREIIRSAEWGYHSANLFFFSLFKFMVGDKNSCLLLCF